MNYRESVILIFRDKNVTSISNPSEPAIFERRLSFTIDSPDIWINHPEFLKSFLIIFGNSGFHFPYKNYEFS